MLPSLWHLLFPPCCAVCGAAMAGSVDTAVCEACAEGFDPVVWPPCACGHTGSRGEDRLSCVLCAHLPTPPASLRAAFWYADPAGRLVRELKYRHAPWLAQTLARVAVVACGDYFDRLRATEAIDLVVPVAMHPLRRWRRGHNHAALIAERLAAVLELEVDVEALRRVRWTPQQSRKADAAERLANVAGSFAVAPGANVRDRRVLLVDDVLTTGATLATAAAALRAAGAASVHAFAITLADADIPDATVGDGFRRRPGDELPGGHT